MLSSRTNVACTGCLFILLSSTSLCEGVLTERCRIGVLEKREWEDFQSHVSGRVVRRESKYCDVAEGKVCPRDVTFWLYTRELRNIPFELDPTGLVTGSYPPFLLGAPLKVLIHGYRSDKDNTINQILRPAYMAHGPYNVISVDWGPLCREHCFKEAAESVPTVGHCVAIFLSNLLSDYPGVFSDVHVLGHSLGAHVAAWASTSLDLPRVTELEPTLPLFTNCDRLLKEGRAEIVDVWHTCSRILGRATPDGTVDIYFNDGTDQPGCNCDPGCSHLRVLEYYRETISAGPLTAFPCRGGWADYSDGNCKSPAQRELAEFGEDMTPGLTGVYLAFTSAQKPFFTRPLDYVLDTRFKSYVSLGGKCPEHDYPSHMVDVLGL